MTTSGPGAPEPDDVPASAEGTQSSVETEQPVESEPVAESDVGERESPPPPWLYEPYGSTATRVIPETPRPGFLVSGSAILLLIGGLLAVIAFFAIKGPVDVVAGAARPGAALLPATGGNSSSQPAPTTTTAPTTDVPAITPTDDPSPAPASPGGLMAVLAAHPLSSAKVTTADVTCTLSRFDPADDRQAVFFQEAKACADAAWAALLDAAGIPAPGIELVIVSAPLTTPCGPLGPADPATSCQATVYMTPAHLRDVESNGRYPGRYFGVFLRAYAGAMQHVTGLTIVYATARNQPDAPVDELDTRLSQQATCLAGVLAAGMAGRGAVDGNITNEIRERLSTIDSPDGAADWLDQGFQTRSLSSCNSWL
ncbi:MAG TPA: hypothetical protein VFV67_19060 [Actinophytocola sp.]|uniref:hypothetical protein n=1 Tax=Actinophytocola sp. TaxID=1872138 RepID=UPI002DBC0A60|nr:hypothetical protein [Actinophytocola sp.]HEU5472751.1 hypothetical protein [Actinophytocola sp.]